MKLYLTMAVAAMAFAGCTASDSVHDVDKGAATAPAHGSEPDPTNDEIHATPAERPAKGEGPENAERPERGDRPMKRGPETRQIPQPAIDACAGLAVDATCAFTMPRGDLTGTCVKNPTDDTTNVCRPTRPARPKN